MKKDMPPKVLNGVSVIASLCGLCLAFISLVNQQPPYWLAVVGMGAASLSLVGCIAWLIDYGRFWLFIPTAVVVAFIILSIAFLVR